MADIIDFKTSKQMAQKLAQKEKEDINDFKQEMLEIEKQIASVESYIFFFPTKQIENRIVSLTEIPKGIITMKIQWTHSKDVFRFWRACRSNVKLSEQCESITIELPIDRRDFLEILKENKVGDYWWVDEYKCQYPMIELKCHYTYYPTTINYLAFVLAQKTAQEIKKIERCMLFLSSVVTLGFPASEDIIKLILFSECNIDELSDDELLEEMKGYFYENRKVIWPFLSPYNLYLR